METLEQRNKEQFDEIADNFKTNRQAIIEALGENRISITNLISKTSREILEGLSSMKEDTRALKDRVDILDPYKEEVSELASYPN